MISAWIGSIAFLFVLLLYILLVAGLPLGDFAMGGKYKIIPNKMRPMYILSIIIQVIAIFVILQTGGIIDMGYKVSIVRGLCYLFAAYVSLNTLMNVTSNSKKEKLVMAPLSFIAAVCFWITAWKA